MTRWEEERPRPSGRLGRGESRRERERRDQATGQNGRRAGAVQCGKKKKSHRPPSLYISFGPPSRSLNRSGSFQGGGRSERHVLPITSTIGAHTKVPWVDAARTRARGSDVKRGEFDTLRMRIDGWTRRETKEEMNTSGSGAGSACLPV